MTPNKFIQEFEHIAEAPNGIQRLRELVLELAVRGLLIPRNPNDEPASVLLQDIARQKERLINQSPNSKKEEESKKEVVGNPYALPNGWRWSRLREVSYEFGQKVPDESFTYIDVTAINKERGFIEEDLQVLRPEEAPSRARKVVDVGTVVYSTVRPYLLNIAIVDRKFDPPPIVSTAFFVMHPFDGISNRYLFYYLRSKPFIDYVNNAMAGMAYPAVNDAKMAAGPVPVPPCAEQQRIVAKVDELMKRCDDLEAWQRQRNERRTMLTASCLHALTSTLRKSASTAIRRVSDNFSLLIDTPESVAELRKSILQLAIHGRLVPQDPTDEPASILLGRVEVEKAHLIREGKIRKQEPMASPDPAVVPYALPKGWTWVRLGDIGYTQTGTTPAKARSEYFGPGYPFVKPGDISEAGVEFGKEEVSEAGMAVARFIPAGSAMMVCIGGSIGKVGYVDRDCSCNQQINTITPFSQQDGRFVAYWMKSPLIQNQVLALAPQTTLPILSKSKWESLLYPLPPLSEQKRILAKIKSFMALCDQLEAKLVKARDDVDTLLAAFVYHLCNPKTANAREISV